MKQETYIINSPNHPTKKDFGLFPVWCQWEDSEEIPFLKSLCESEKEYENKIIAEYKKGKETYYPIPSLSTLPDHRYLLIKAKIIINTQNSLEGYLTTSDNEVVSITIWPEPSNHDYEVDLYKYDRLVAEEENTGSLMALSKILGISDLNQVQYSTMFCFSTGQNIEGEFRCV